MLDDTTLVVVDDFVVSQCDFEAVPSFQISKQVSWNAFEMNLRESMRGRGLGG